MAYHINMRIQIASFIILVATTGLVSGQSTTFGIKVGLNSSKVSSTLSATGLPSQSDKTENFVSFSAGMYGIIWMSDKIGLQPELLFSRQGGGASDSSMRFSYLLLPIMFRYNPIPALSFQAGPQLGVLLSAQFLGVDFKEQLSTTDFSLAFGFGYEFPFHVDVGLRYIVGLSNIFKADLSASGIPGLTSTMNNQVLQLSVGYRFVDR